MWNFNGSQIVSKWFENLMLSPSWFFGGAYFHKSGT